MKKHDQFYELPADRRWYHRLVLWFRRLLGKSAPPRYFMGVDYGNGYERSCWMKIKVNPDGTKEVVAHGFHAENVPPKNKLIKLIRLADNKHKAL